MISKKMEKQLNQQIKEEFNSASIYLAASAWCSAHDLHGMARFLRLQAQEENEHGMKFYDYLLEVGAAVVVPGVDQPQASFRGVKEIFQQALKHEQFITGCINKLMKQAHEESDFATINFLNWFIAEQIEEEALFQDILAKLDMLGQDKRGLYLLNKELGEQPVEE